MDVHGSAGRLAIALILDRPPLSLGTKGESGWSLPGGCRFVESLPGGSGMWEAGSIPVRAMRPRGVHG